MTPMQERFARAYVRASNGNAAAAARAAGSRAKSEASAGSLGRKWLARDDVRARIDELTNEAAKHAVLDRATRTRELEKIACDATVGMSHRLRAFDMLNKMDGTYTVIRTFDIPTPPTTESKITDAQVHYFFETGRIPPPGMTDAEIEAAFAN